MKNINNYILEKLRISKDVKVEKTLTRQEAFDLVKSYIKSDTEHKDTSVSLYKETIDIYVDKSLHYNFKQLTEFKDKLIDLINSNSKVKVGKDSSYVEKDGNKIEIWLWSLK